MVGPPVYEYIPQNPNPTLIVTFETDTASQGTPFDAQDTIDVFASNGGVAEIVFLPGA